MAHTITDSGNYIEFNRDGVKTHVLKPFDIDIEGGTVLIFKNDFDLNAEELTLQPGEWITLAAKSVTGTPSYVTGSLNTREDQ